MFLYCQKISTKWTLGCQEMKKSKAPMVILLVLQRASKSLPWRKDSPYPKVNVQLVIPADGAGIPSDFISTL